MVAITATSLGYRGSIDEVNGARFFNRVGASQYGVAGRTDFAASVTTGDRMLRLTAGTAWAHNIVDEMATAATIQLDAVGSGQRWDMIVLRRNTSTSTTTLEVIKGTSTKALPARPASAHPDQPLWLARVVAGQSTVQELVDLRVWASTGGATARDQMVLGYLDADPGAAIEIAGVTWQRRITTAGTAMEWAPVAGVETFYPLANIANWDRTGGASVKMLPEGIRRVDLALIITRRGSSVTYSTNQASGWTGIIPAEARGRLVGAGITAIHGYSPLYLHTNREDTSFARLTTRIEPETGSLYFLNEGAAGSYTWALGRSIIYNATYFVR